MPESSASIRLRLLGARQAAREGKTVERSLRGVGQGGIAASGGLATIARTRAPAALKQVTKAAQQATTAVSNVGRAGAIGGGAVALGAGVGLLAAVKSGADFEQQMANVQSRLLTTRSAMAPLNKLALDLGAKTSFSASQAAGGMDQLAAAGFTTGQIISTLPGTLSLAAASGTELADAAQLQGAAIRGFGLQASDAGKVADVLALTVNKSALEMSDLGETLPYVASTARQTGTSFEEVAAMAGILGNAGIKGSMAGTALRTSMLRLTDPSKKMRGALGGMGIEASTLAAIPLPNVIGRIADGIKRLPTRGQRVGAVSAIFGKEAAPSVLNLLSKGRAGIDAFATSLKNTKSAAGRMAAIQRDTVKGAFDNLTGSIETASIKLTQRFQPAIKNVLNDAAGGVNKLADFGSAAVIALAGGPKKARPGAWRSNAMGAGPPPKATGGEKAGLAARGMLKSTVQAGRAALAFISGTVTPGVLKAAGQVLDALKPATPLLTNVLLPALKGVAIGVLSGVVGAFNVAVPVIKVVATVLGFVGKVLKPLEPVFVGLGVAVGVLFGPAILGAGARVLGTLARAAGPVLGGALSGLSFAFRAMTVPARLLTGVVRGAAPVFGVLGRGLQFANRWLSMSTSWFGRLAFQATNLLSTLVGLPGGAIGAIGRLGSGIVSRLGAAAGGVASAAGKIASSIMGRLAGLPSRAIAVAGRVVSAIARGLRGAAGRVASAAGSIGRAIVTGVVNAIKAAPGAITGAIAGIVPDPVKKAAGGVLGLVTGRAIGGTVRRGETTLVGERGPELARFPGGTRITPAGPTRRTLTDSRMSARVQRAPYGVRAGGARPMQPVRLEMPIEVLFTGAGGKELHRIVTRVQRDIDEGA